MAATSITPDIAAAVQASDAMVPEAPGHKRVRVMVIVPAYNEGFIIEAGVGRGVDLISYLAIPGLLLLILVLFSKTRELNAKLTAAVRAFAIRDGHVPRQSGGRK
jgi:hypothetical protein